MTCMKRLSFLAGTTSLLMCACTQMPQAVDFPLAGAANTTSIVIERVERTDSATVLTVRGFNMPGNWINVKETTKLVADGVEYKLREGSSIEIGKAMTLPEDGDTCFTLCFAPLAKECRAFDYIEGDAEGDWRIYDLDLTGKRDANAPEGLPEELKGMPKTDVEPRYAYEFGDVTVNVHLLGYREGVENDIILPINSLLEEQKSVDVKIDPNTGKGTATFRQYGTGYAFSVVNGRWYGSFYVAPGDSIDLYVNLGNINFTNRFNYYGRVPMEMPTIKQCWTKGGRYDAMNNLPAKAWDSPDSTDISHGLRYNITAEQYTDHVINNYKVSRNHMDRQPWHTWQKEMEKANHQHGLIMYMKQDIRRWMEREPEDTFNLDLHPILPQHYEKVMAHVDTDNPWLLLSEYSNELIKSVPRELKSVQDNRMLQDMILAYDAVKEAYKGQLADSTLQRLRTMDNPFYADMCEDIMTRTLKAIAQSSKNLQNVEEIAPEAIFQAIIEPHKGKVVVVDFWNTWCGPCRHALKQVKPLKESGPLATDDIVWVYIANETSPIAQYNEMISDIKGLHYRLNNAQWRYLTDKLFNIDGIPSYVLVQKDGTYALRNDLRDHALLLPTLKDALAR